MYEAFFNLKHKPFSLLPDPEFLFLSDKHAIALSLLEYCLSGQAGFCIITGDIGSGKTTLIRAFLGRIGRDFSVGLISNTHAGLTDISAWALNAFGQKPSSNNPAETYQELMAFLIAEYGAGRQCILIVDEAQNLSLQALEELRLLSNINTGKDLLLQMVLVGQPELLEKLRRPELSQFAQRIAVSHHLTPLPFTDSRRYIEHRLKVAGCDRQIFTEMAMGAVQYFSGGVPRLINSICDMALVYAFADGASTIGEDLVFRVVADRQRSGIAPFASAISADDPNVRAAISDLANDKAAPQPVAAQAAAVQPVAAPPIAAQPAAAPPVAAQPAAVRPAAVQPMTPQPQPAPFEKQEAPVAAAAATLAAVQAPAELPADGTAEALRPQPLNAGKQSIPTIPGPRKATKPSGELYFAESDDDELLLTVQANDRPVPVAAPQMPPLRATHRIAPAALADDPLLRVDPVLTNSELVNDTANVTSVRPTEALHPSWQHPAATLDSEPWPSISKGEAEPATGRTEAVATAVAISGQSPGTAAPSRRSWWRRSFSRGK